MLLAILLGFGVSTWNRPSKPANQQTVSPADSTDPPPDQPPGPGGSGGS
jgi:hypothetical protein